MKSLNVSLLSLLLIGFMAFTACQNSDSEATSEETAENLASPPTSTAANEKPAGNTAEVPTPTGPTTTISFEENTFDFGAVDEGEKVSHVYKFTNTGNEPLVISNAKGSCGCTVPKWPKTPIPPGETGEILVEFASKGKSGKQTKRVTITANTDPAQTFLTITGNVIKKESEEG